MPETKRRRWPEALRVLGHGALAAAVISLVFLIPGRKPAPEPRPDPLLVRQAHAERSAPDLAVRLTRLGQAFDGRVGIAVRDLDEDWTASFDGDTVFPQQSVSKIWVALAVLDAVDRGALALHDTIQVRREDLSVFHQPLRRQVGRRGAEVTVDQLLALAISHSDNAANDILLRLAGGRAAVAEAVKSRKLQDIRASPSERDIQTRTAGLEWRPEYSFARTFWRDRAQLPLEYRRAALDAYLADPPDGASPDGLVEALDRLTEGKLLGRASTDYLIRLMAESETGRSRLRAGLAPGWTLAHKTGTGQVMGEVATGFNDVGIMTAPDGHRFAVAVMIAQTRAPVEDRQALMAEVARAVIDHHDAVDHGATGDWD